MRENISAVDNTTKTENESASTSYAVISVKKSDFEKNVDPKPVGVVFSRNVRQLIFILIMITNLIINMDHGTIPAATSEIKLDLNIDDESLGIFGSLVFFGNLLGAMIFFSIIRDYNRKLVILLSLTMILILICLFGIIKNEYFLYFNRAITGIFQAFLAIYFPVWCYQFGHKEQKNTMIALLQLCVPLGVVVGYILTVVIKSVLTWNYSLYIQCGLTGIVIIIFIFIPNIYFSATLHNERITSIDNAEHDDSKRKSDAFSVYKEEIDETETENTNLWGNLKYLCGNFLFLSFAIALGFLYFIITVVQFWATDYLKNVLNTPENIVSVAFTVTCISAPTLGIIIGSFSLSKAGGPQSNKSTIICLLFSIGGTICSIPIPFAEEVYSFTGLLWIILFFGGAMVPIITGIIITSVPVNFRSSGNSLSNFLSNLIGYLPAPFVYGLISKYEKDINPRLAMMICMYTSAIGMIFIILGCYFKFKYAKEKKVEDSKKSIKEEIDNNAILIANLWGNNNLNSKEIIEREKILGNTSKSLYIKDGCNLFLEDSDSNINGSSKEINDFKSHLI